jgi:hypothetical protein
VPPRPQRRTAIGNPEEYKNNNRPPVVCEKHFASDFIVREDKVTRPDGTVLSVLRKKPKLIENAYPTIFPKSQHAILSVHGTAMKEEAARRSMSGNVSTR